MFCYKSKKLVDNLIHGFNSLSFQIPQTRDATDPDPHPDTPGSGIRPEPPVPHAGPAGHREPGKCSILCTICGNDFTYHEITAGAQPPHEGVRERRAVDGDEEEQEALEEERRQGEEPQQLRVRSHDEMKEDSEVETHVVQYEWFAL